MYNTIAFNEEDIFDALMDLLVQDTRSHTGDTAPFFLEQLFTAESISSNVVSKVVVIPKFGSVERITNPEDLLNEFVPSKEDEVFHNRNLSFTIVAFMQNPYSKKHFTLFADFNIEGSNRVSEGKDNRIALVNYYTESSKMVYTTLRNLVNVYALGNIDDDAFWANGENDYFGSIEDDSFYDIIEFYITNNTKEHFVRAFKSFDYNLGVQDDNSLLNELKDEKDAVKFMKKFHYLTDLTDYADL